MTPKELDLLRKELDELLESDHIQPSKSPYGSPSIDGLMDQLHGAKVFSKIDLSD
jgi:hypothetical protein